MVAARNLSKMLLLACIVLATGFYFLAREIEPKTDVLWLQFIGYEVFEPQRTQAVLDRLPPVATDYERLETQRRVVMRWNYPINVISARIGAVLGGTNLVAAVAVGLGLPFLIGVAGFLFAAAKSRELGPLILSAAYFALTALLPGPSPTDHLLYYGTGIKDALNLVALLVNPGGAFNPLSVQPKTIVMLLVMAALALRRGGRRRSAYGLLAASALWHISFAAVVLGLFLVVDGLTARVFRNRSPYFEGGLVVALCVSGAAVCAGIYVATRSGMTWGVESAFIQLSARLLVLAEVIAVGHAGYAAWQWLDRHLGDRKDRLLGTAAGFVAVVAVYAAAGMAWERGRYYSAQFEDKPLIATYGPLATYYDTALRQLAPPQGRLV